MSKHRKIILRTHISPEKIKIMKKRYLFGWSLRDLAERYHYAIPTVKRTIACVTKLKPQGRPRKEKVA